MENYKCRICSEISESSVTCLKCQKSLCKKHFNSDNICPCCNCFPFKYKENPILRNPILDPNSIYKCNLCPFKGDKNAFWIHLIENHKEEIILKFKENDDTPIQIKNIDNNEKYKPRYSLNINNLSNISNFENIYNNSDISEEMNRDFCGNEYDNIYKKNDIQSLNNISQKKLNNYNNDLQSHSSISNIKISKTTKFNINQENNLNKNNNIIRRYKSIDENNKLLFYCEHKNKDIKCECCPDHICKKGNCLCVKCMRYNLFKLKLVNGELINKAGRIAKFIKGHYYCGCQYESIYENCERRKIKKCEYSSEPCDDCKVLTKFRNIYFR